MQISYNLIIINSCLRQWYQRIHRRGGHVTRTTANRVEIEEVDCPIKRVSSRLVVLKVGENW